MSIMSYGSVKPIPSFEDYTDAKIEREIIEKEDISVISGNHYSISHHEGNLRLRIQKYRSLISQIATIRQKLENCIEIMNDYDSHNGGICQSISILFNSCCNPFRELDNLRNTIVQDLIKDENRFADEFLKKLILVSDLKQDKIHFVNCAFTGNLKEEKFVKDGVNNEILFLINNFKDEQFKNDRIKVKELSKYLAQPDRFEKPEDRIKAGNDLVAKYKIDRENITNRAIPCTPSEELNYKLAILFVKLQETMLNTIKAEVDKQKVTT